jgi:hypothetical protein
MFHSPYPLLVVSETVDISETLVGSVLAYIHRNYANNYQE